MDNFTKRLLLNSQEQKLNDFIYKKGAKDFADKLAETREADALAMAEQAKMTVDMPQEKQLHVLQSMAVSKLREVGYTEFAEIFKACLKRGE